MKLNPARQLAQRIADTMQPYADGVTIAGAIRRRVAEKLSKPSRRRKRKPRSINC